MRRERYSQPSTDRSAQEECDMKRQGNELLNTLGAYAFAAHDTALFLDTHPNDETAMKAFCAYRDKADDLRREYTAQCGPLRKSDVTQSWNEWIKSPWPWQ